MVNLPRSAEIWLPGYLRDRAERIWQGAPSRISLAITDHFEPYWAHASDDLAYRRAALWAKRWPEIADRIAAAHGFQPKYTFFYPEEEYRPKLIDLLVPSIVSGVADLEVHIHHNGEGEQNFVDRISGFIEKLHHRHGLLRRVGGRIVFGFIHGNWALDNSLPNGKCCGLNNEISLLKKLGCYADFTLPAGEPGAQTRIVNTIYWALDDVDKPKSHDTGVRFTAGSGVKGDLLMVPGPLGVRWVERLIPRMELGELASHDPATAYRCRRWIDLSPRSGEDSIIKLHTHGAQEKNSAALLEGGLEELFRHLAAAAKRVGAALRGVTAYDIYRNLVGEAVLADETILSNRRD